MNALQNLYTMLITMMILLLAGFFWTKKGLLSTEVRKKLSDLILLFVLPCNILKSFMIRMDIQILLDCGMILLMSFGIQLLSIFLGHAAYGRKDDRQRAVLQYGLQVSNAGFLGNPVMEGMYGAQGLLYASIYLIPLRILMWSVGISCFTGRSGKGVLKRILTHPCIIATVIGLVVMIGGITPPNWISKPIQLVAGCNTALSLLVVGGALAELDPRHLFNRHAVGFCVLRLLVIPLAALAVCMLLGTETMVSHTAVILAGMPAPMTAVMLSTQYDKDVELSVSLIFLSTLLSMATIPLLSILITYL